MKTYPILVDMLGLLVVLH